MFFYIAIRVNIFERTPTRFAAHSAVRATGESAMSLKAKFTEHPASVGETYGEHCATAMGFSLALLKAAFCCAVHAVLPFLFVKTGSACIGDLHDRMVTNRAKASAPGNALPG